MAVIQSYILRSDKSQRYKATNHKDEKLQVLEIKKMQNCKLEITKLQVRNYKDMKLEVTNYRVTGYKVTRKEGSGSEKRVLQVASGNITFAKTCPFAQSRKQANIRASCAVLPVLTITTHSTKKCSKGACPSQSDSPQDKQGGKMAKAQTFSFLRQDQSSL